VHTDLGIVAERMPSLSGGRGARRCNAYRTDAWLPKLTSNQVGLALDQAKF
jgi:hypothetical protein